MYQTIIKVAIKLRRFWAENYYFTLFQRPVKPVINGKFDNYFLDNWEQFYNDKNVNIEKIRHNYESQILPM